MTDLDATTSVEVVLRGRAATIADMQHMLGVLTAEGIPDTFEVDIHQSTVRIPEEGVDYRDQRTEPILTVTARRAARNPATTGAPSHD